MRPPLPLNPPCASQGWRERYRRGARRGGDERSSRKRSSLALEAETVPSLVDDEEDDDDDEDGAAEPVAHTPPLPQAPKRAASRLVPDATTPDDVLVPSSQLPEQAPHQETAAAEKALRPRTRSVMDVLKMLGEDDAGDGPELALSMATVRVCAWLRFPPLLQHNLLQDSCLENAFPGLQVGCRPSRIPF